MRKDVKKFLFIGHTKEKEPFFKEAQELGLIHFIDIAKTQTSELPADLEHLSNALRILRRLPVLEQEEIDSFDRADSLVDAINTKNHTLDKLHEELRILRLEIARVEPFGPFSKEDIDYIQKEGNRSVQFFWAKQGSFEQEPLPKDVFFIKSDHGIDYFVGVSPEPIHGTKLVEMTIEKPLQELRKQYEKSEHEKIYLEENLKTYQKYSTYLHHAIVDKLNRYHLNSTQNYVQLTMDGEIFAIEGWVPVDKIELVKGLTGRFGVHQEEIAIEPTDVIPTYLENEGTARVGEDLVRIYDVPSHTDKDPSIWVLIFFSLFFAFIIGDGGYGLIFAGIALYIRYRYQKMTLVGHRVWKLLVILAGACILWGVITNSFFGYSPAPNSPVMKVSFLNYLVKRKIEYHWSKHDSTYKEWVKKFPATADMHDPEKIALAASETHNGKISYDLQAKFADNILMELALVIGMVHIILSMLRYGRRNLVNLGWVLFIIGAYLYLPEYLGATTMTQYILGIDTHEVATQGLYLIAGGVGLAIFFSVLKHKANGLMEFMGAIQVFSDVLSYLRLYALGMAGLIMSETVNEGALAFGGVIGLLIIIFGHFFNIVLSIMSGVIHGLRLNFLEWYHYSFEGGGKLFRPLKKIKIE